MSSQRQTIFVGPFVHSKSLTELDVCEKGIIGVENGKIAFIERSDKNAEKAAQERGWKSFEVVRATDDGFFFPGFIDTHSHAPQYPNLGIFGKSTLLDWLNKYTFPLEGSFRNIDRAKHVYHRVVSRTLSHGTTTAAYYATIHVPATNLLADICQAKGQRALIGRVCMNTMSPEDYRDESVAEALKASRECIDHVKRIDPEHELITPVITPRFAPSCTKDCLAELGKLHHETGCPVQTHISENTAEIELVKELFPESRSYAHVYDEAGLLTDKTILAHAVHLTPDERDLVRARGSKIAHCPASNTALTSGCARVRRLLDAGIAVGLGTDFSGGYSPSVLEMARHAILVSRHVAMTDGDAASLSVEEALHLATRGGARVVGLEDRIGGFDVGMDWDAQMISLGRVDGSAQSLPENEGPVDIFGWESWEERVQKWVFAGNAQNTAAVWVKGRLVHSTSKYQP